jgi:hypothetical protein
MPRLEAQLLVVLLAGCGAEGTADPAEPPGACASDDVPLRVLRDALGPARLYALATLDGEEVSLIVDTGSQISFLVVPQGSTDPTPNAGTVRLGCRERTLAGRPIPIAEEIDGRRVVGMIGNDLFFERTTDIDLAAERIHVPTAAELSTPRGAALTFENLYDYMFVRARLDGVDLRLGFDTGASHSLWLGQDGEAGDQPVSTQDAYGNPLTLYLGSALLEIEATAARSVPLLRAPSFPSLEDANEALGGNIQGLFGLTSMGEHIRIDAAAHTIWIAPGS